MGILIVRLVQIITNAPPIEAVKLPDGRLGATLKSICNLLGIARPSQLLRIRRNPDLAPALVLAPIATSGGPQVVDVILSWAIPIWLSGLQVSRLAPEKQAIAELLRQQAISSIEQAFTGTEPETPEPMLAADLLINAWQQAQQGLDMIAAGVQEVQTAFGVLAHEHAVVLARLAALERSAPAGNQISLLPEALPAGPDVEAQAHRQESADTRRLLSASVERIVDQEGRLIRLEKLHPPPPAKRQGRPRKHTRP